LSYQPNTFAMRPVAWVRRASNTQDAGSPTMSVETSGASAYRMMPCIPRPAATATTSLICAAVTSVPSSSVRSLMEPSTTGTRSATPSSRPARSGSTRPIAFAAPVLVGMMFTPAARARRGSLCGASSTFWSLVYACTVVR
jgi:hypothetical protein